MMTRHLLLLAVLVSLVTGHWSLTTPVWADEFEAKEDLTVSGTGGTLKNPNLEVKGNAAIFSDLHIHNGIIASPYGGLGTYENLTINSEALDQWTAETKWTVTANTADTTAPDGTATVAEKLVHGTTGNGYLYRYVAASGIAGKTYTFSLWLKGAAGGEVVPLRIESRDVNSSVLEISTQNATVTTAWQRYSVTKAFASPASDTATKLLIGLNDAGTTAYTAYAWGAQLEQAGSPSVYVQTTTTAVTASKGLVTNADLRMLNLSLAEGGTFTMGDANLYNSASNVLKTDDTLNVAGNLQVTGAGPHYFSAGSVGIGTTSAAARLSLAGTGVSNGIYLGSDQASPISIYYNTSPVDRVLQFDAARVTFTSTGYFTLPNLTYVGAGLYFTGNNAQVTGTSLTFKNPGNTADVSLQNTGGAGVANLAISGGNVGIGTTNPAEELHVAVGDIRVSDGGVATATPAEGRLIFDNQYDNAGNATANKIVLFDDGAWKAGIGISSSDVDFFSGANFRFYTDHVSEASPGTEVFMIQDATGNVGIGTTTPGAKLHVLDGTGNLYIDDYGCGAYGGIGANSTVTGCANYALLANASDTFLNRPSGGSLYFREANSTQMVILPTSGNVGIGTTVPGALLDVQGSVAWKGVNVAAAANGGTVAEVSGNYPANNTSPYTTGVGSTAAWGSSNAIDGDTAAGADTSTWIDANGENGVTFIKVTFNKTYVIDRVRLAGRYDASTTDGQPQEFQLDFSDGSVQTFTFPSSYTGMQEYMIRPVATSFIRYTTRSKYIGGNNGLRELEAYTRYTGTTNSLADNRVMFYNTAKGSEVYSKVGIGTTAPAAGLTIGAGTNNNATTANDLYVTGNLEVDGNAYLGDNISVDTLTVNSAVTLGTTATLNGNLQVTGAGPHYISAGSVGIGTTSPGAKLEVTGDLLFSKGADRTISIAGETAVNGNALTIAAGAGTTNNSGAITVRGGEGGTSTHGGAATFRGGDGTGVTSASGGVVTIRGGIGVAGGTTGSVNLQPTAGSVGIGTTAPAAKLDVVGDLIFSGADRNIDTNGNLSLSIIPDIYLNLGTSSSDAINIGRADSNILTSLRGHFAARPVTDSATAFDVQNAAGTSVLDVDTSAGRVGIGTTAPGSKLEISVPTEGNLQLGSTNGGYIQIQHTTGATTFDINQSVASGDLRLYATRNIQLRTSSVDPAVTVLQNGNVGIGTTSPGWPLHVYSNTNTDQRVYFENPNSGSSARMKLTLKTDGRDVGTLTSGSAAAGDAFGLVSDINNTGFMTFNTRTGGSYAERMRLVNSGNLGLGTTTPQTQLELTGILASPYGGLGTYENALLQSEAFGTTWTLSQQSAADGQAAPDGTTNADLMQNTAAAAGYAEQVATPGTPGTSTAWVFSVWLKSGTTSNVEIKLTPNGTSPTVGTQTLALTSTWQRYSVAATTGTSGTTTLTARITNLTATSGLNFAAWGAQLEKAASPGVYVQTTTTAVAASAGLVTNTDLRLLNLSLSEAGTLTLGADTNLYRSAANTLKTDDSLAVTGDLQVSGAVSVGTNPATTGAIRLANNEAIVSRNGANSADVTMFFLTPSNAIAINALVSSFTFSGTLSSNTPGGSHIGASGAAFGNIYGTTFLAGGTGTATSGAIRLQNAAWIAGRNAANSANVNMINVRSDDLVGLANDKMVINDSSGYVGIGTTNPTSLVDIWTTENVGLNFGNVSANALQRPILSMSRARGTVGSPTVVSDDDNILTILGFPYIDGAYRAAVSIEAQVDNPVGTSDWPTRLTFWTTNDGAGARTEKMRIDNAGNVGIGTTAPASLLDVGGELQVNTSGYLSDTNGNLTLNDAVTVSANNSLSIAAGTGTLTISGYSGTTTALPITVTSTSNNSKGLSVSHTGAITGTGYGVHSTVSGASTTNVAGYFTATGATNNYAAIFDSGSVGIGTTAPVNSGLQLKRTLTMTSGTESGLLINSLSATPASASTLDARGIYSQATWNNTNTGTSLFGVSTLNSVASATTGLTNQTGLHSFTRISDGTAATVTTMRGLNVQSVDAEDGTVTTAYGADIQMPSVDAGALTTGYGVYLRNADALGAGTYDTLYGLYVEAPTRAATNQTAVFANDGALGGWSTNANALTAARQVHSSVVANGYVYVVGGDNTGAQSTVYYAKLNADGSTGTWTTNANALPATRQIHSSVVANGYLYVVGGVGASTVYYAKLNADGSTGTWTTNANALPAVRYRSPAVAANGYLYVIGGNDGGGAQSTVYYAKLNADGSTGTWTTNANALTAARSGASAVAANGYLYVLGGWNGADQSTVYYAKLNADGSTGAWTTNANALPAARNSHTSVVANGYVYVLGGSAAATTVYYARLNANGSTGTWTTNARVLPAGRLDHTSIVANGYVYVLGGSNGTTPQTTVYYASTVRVSIAGNLDLVGLTGQTLGDATADNSSGSAGGTITAGNIFSNGALEVGGNAQFWNGVSVVGPLSTSSDVTSAGNLRVTGAGPHYVSAGSVGIGTTTPTNKLEVVGLNGAATTDHAIKWGNPGIGVQGYLGGSDSSYNSGAVYLYQNGSANTRISANGDTFFMGGNVGIGTTTPGGLLALDPTATGTVLDMALETQWTGGTLLTADFGSATTQTAAMTGMKLDLNTNLTVPNSSSGDQTGLSITMKDGGASAASTGLRIISGDTGIAINGGGLPTTAIAIGSSSYPVNSTTGISMDISTLTTGTGIAISGSSSASYNTSVNGDVIRIAQTRTHTGAAQDTSDAGSFLDLVRAYGINMASQTYTINGDMVSFANTLTETAGNMVDNSNILSVAQNCGTNAACTGAVVMVTNNGTGASLRVNDDGTETDSTPFFIDASGNVGIGTTVPATALDVNGALSVREMSAPAASPLDQGRIYFDATANKFKVSENAGGYVDLISAGGSGDVTDVGNCTGNACFTAAGTGTDLVFNAPTASDTDYWISLRADAQGDDDDTLQIGDGTTPGTNPWLAIKTDGKVGIGTTNPSTKFQVHDSVNNYAVLQLTATGTGSGGTDGGSIQVSGTVMDIVNYENDRMSLWTNGQNQLTISNIGNVGIGTTTPREKLEIIGNMQAVDGTVYAPGVRRLISAITSATTGTSDSTDKYQTFTPEADIAVTGVRPKIYSNVSGAGEALYACIYDEGASADTPGTRVSVTNGLNANAITTSVNYPIFTFSNPVNLRGGKKYVLRIGGSTSCNATADLNSDSYANGTDTWVWTISAADALTNGRSETNAGQDFLFSLEGSVAPALAAITSATTGTSDTTDKYQSFTTLQDMAVTAVRPKMYSNVTGNGDALYACIYDDNASDAPGTRLATSAGLNANAITTSVNYPIFTFSNPVNLRGGKKYVLRIGGGTSCNATLDLNADGYTTAADTWVWTISAADALTNGRSETNAGQDFLFSLDTSSNAVTSMVVASELSLRSGYSTANTKLLTVVNPAGTTVASMDIEGNMFVSLQNTGTEAICTTSNDAATNAELTSCSGTPAADYMEMYAMEPGIEPGDIVMPGPDFVTTDHGERVAKLAKTTAPYQPHLIGIVSDPAKAGDFNSIGYNIPAADHPMPLALNGRLPVKVSTENGPIQVGDYLTSSSLPGVAMKATRAGTVIGKALEPFDGASGSPCGEGLVCGKAMVFAGVTYADPYAELANKVTSLESRLDELERRLEQ